MFQSEEIIDALQQETRSTLEESESQSFFMPFVDFINSSSSESQFNYDTSYESQPGYQINSDNDSDIGHSISSLNTYHPNVLKQKYQELLKLNESEEDEEINSQEDDTESINEQFDEDNETNAIQSIHNYQTNIELLSNFTKKYKLDQSFQVSKQSNQLD